MNTSIRARLRALHQPAKQAARIATVGLTLAALAHPAVAGPLKAVLTGANVVSDTVLAVCLPLMTAAWGFCGVKMAAFGASMRDVTGPFWGGAICAGCSALAIAFA